METTWAIHILKSLRQTFIYQNRTRVSAGFSLFPLSGDASTRHYFRVHHSAIPSVVVTWYPDTNDEETINRQIRIYGWLKKINWPVPAIYAFDPASRIIIQEDGGDELLQDYVIKHESNHWIGAYQHLITLWHGLQESGQACQPPPDVTHRRLDADRFLFELMFFHEHFLKKFAGIQLSGSDETRLMEGYQELSITLDRAPRAICHRDYHSRNVLVKDNRILLIDYQDMQIGPLYYDLVSLLYDAYVRLPEDFINKIRQDLLKEVIEDESLWLITALQRHLKALGTFGYQITCRKNPRYRPAIYRTCTYILNNEEIDAFPQLKNLRSILVDCA